MARHSNCFKVDATEKNIICYIASGDIWSEHIYYLSETTQGYCKKSKIRDIKVLANSADLDQTAPEGAV